MSGPDMDRLDRALGKLDALMLMQREQAGGMDLLAERVVRLEEGVKATRDVVDAWTTAKTSMRLIKWTAALLATLAGLAVAARAWLQR